MQEMGLAVEETQIIPSWENLTVSASQCLRKYNDIPIERKLMVKWQNIVDIMAELVNVPAGLIVKFNGEELEIFVSSNTEPNPYIVGNKLIMLGSRVYCETVIKTKSKLLVGNALLLEEWLGAPDIKLGMMSYLGYPLMLPDGSIFGTICVLDIKENYYSETYEKLILQFKDLIESQLSLMFQKLELENIANRDWLTKLYNRKYLFELGENLYKTCQITNRLLSVAVIDIDFFKKINDVYGHDGGDFILKNFAQILRENTRETDIVARLGGEEFCILLDHCSLEQAFSICERIRKTLEETVFDYNEQKFSVIISCGISSVLEGSLQKMINQADVRLYKAKNSGRNQVCF